MGRVKFAAEWTCEFSRRFGKRDQVGSIDFCDGSFQRLHFHKQREYLDVAQRTRQFNLERRGFFGGWDETDGGFRKKRDLLLRKLWSDLGFK